MSYHIDSFRLRPPRHIHPLPAAGNACFNCLKCWQATRWTLSLRGGGEGLLGLRKSMAITVSNDIWIKRPWTEPKNTSKTNIWSTTVLSLLTIPLWATKKWGIQKLYKYHTDIHNKYISLRFTPVVFAPLAPWNWGLKRCPSWWGRLMPCRWPKFNLVSCTVQICSMWTHHNPGPIFKNAWVSLPARGLMGQRSEEQQQIHEQAACGDISTDIPNIQNNLGFFDVGVSNQRCARCAHAYLLRWHWLSIPSWLFKKINRFPSMSCAPSNPQIREHPCLSSLTRTHTHRKISWNSPAMKSQTQAGIRNQLSGLYSQHVLHSTSETLCLRDACCIHSLRSKPTIASHFLEVFPQKSRSVGDHWTRYRTAFDDFNGNRLDFRKGLATAQQGQSLVPSLCVTADGSTSSPESKLMMIYHDGWCDGDITKIHG